MSAHAVSELVVQACVRYCVDVHALHIVQLDAPAVEKVPIEQATHDVASLVEVVPGSQGVHTVS